jgi:hypothetical protein
MFLQISIVCFLFPDIPEVVQQRMMGAGKQMTVEIKRGGDEESFTITRDSGDGKPETTHFTLGQWFNIVQNGVEIKVHEGRGGRF